MPSQRLQVDSGITLPGIRPVAAPVDTFVAPQQSKLAQLANALGNLEPKLQRFTDALQDNRDASSLEQGKQEAEKIRNEGLTLAEATRKGRIPASHNPFFMKGLREQLGRNSADKLDGDLRAAISNDENLQQSTDIQDFDKFSQEFRNKWVQDNIGQGDQDQAFNTGFMFRADAYVTQARNAFAGGIEGKVQSQSDEATHAEVYKHVVDGAGTLSAEAIGQDITNLADDLIQKQGRNGKRVMQTISQAIAAAALNNPDKGLKILEVMKHVKTPYGTLEASSHGAQLSAQVRDKVTDDLWTQNEREISQARAEKQARVDATLSDYMMKSAANPDTPIEPYLLALKDDPHAAEQLDGIKSNLASLKATKTDEPTKGALWDNIWQGKGTRISIIRARRAGKLTAGDASFLNEQLIQFEKTSDEKSPESKALKDFVFQRELSNLRDRFADPLTGVVKADLADKHAHASALLISDYLANQDKLEKMTEQQKAQWLSDRTDFIVKKQRGDSAFTMDPGPGTQGQFNGKAGEKPKLVDRIPKEPVLTADDLRAFQKGQATDNLQRIAAQAHITEEELPEFVRSQLDLLTKRKKKP